MLARVPKYLQRHRYLAAPRTQKIGRSRS
jgi:hypothetical protein